MQTVTENMASILDALLPREATLETSVKGLTVFRVDKSFPRSPVSYDAAVIILAQGEKQVHLGSDVFRYDPANYLVLSVPLPIECEGKVKPGKPILGFSINIDPLEVGEILLEAGDHPTDENILPRGIYGAPMTHGLQDACVRLLQSLSIPEDKRVLAPMYKREILYRVLQGDKGVILQALAHRHRRFFLIAKVLQKIHESYHEDLNMETLAREFDMSSSTFHSSFKAVTNTSPLQYIKHVRLHKARNLLIKDGLNASIAANKVGYESPSQFSREYKRLFGASPARDVAIMRET